MNVEMNITTIREYQPTDKNAVIDLIRQNTPAYFAPKEEADFSNYLDSERELYFVLLLNKKVVGCGGINFTKDKASGKISWDIIHPQYQGKSLGAQLLKYSVFIYLIHKEKCNSLLILNCTFIINARYIPYYTYQSLWPNSLFGFLSV